MTDLPTIVPNAIPYKFSINTNIPKRVKTSDEYTTRHNLNAQNAKISEKENLKCQR
jgi:hypothetical protein